MKFFFNITSMIIFPCIITKHAEGTIITGCDQEGITQTVMTSTKSVPKGWIKVSRDGLEPVESSLPDLSLRMYYDIETITLSGNRKEENDRIMTISAVFVSGNNKHSYCIQAYDSFANPDYTLIRCQDEAEMLSSFIGLIETFKPIFMIAFNDANFDMKWLCARFTRFGLMQRFARSADHCDFTPDRYIVDCEALRVYSDEYICNLKVPDDKTKVIRFRAVKTRVHPCTGVYVRGTQMISIDLRVALMRKVGKVAGRTKLDCYARVCGSKKNDMDYNDMYKQFICIIMTLPYDTDTMTRVSDYCVQDSALLHLIEKHYNVLEHFRKKGESLEKGLFG